MATAAAARAFSHRRPRLLSTTPYLGPQLSSPTVAVAFSLSVAAPSPARAKPWAPAANPKYHKLKVNAEKRTWTGSSFCSDSRGRWRAPTSRTRSVGGRGTRRTSASGGRATEFCLRCASCWIDRLLDLVILPRAGASRVCIHLTMIRSH